jgi:serine/threonine protein kinase
MEGAMLQMKPTNVLVRKNCELKICDFGLARVDREISAQDPSTFMTEHVVTRWYRAPEVILSWGRYSKAIDVWSAGCILAELMARTPVFPGKNYIHQLELITDVLGKPSEAEIVLLENEKARKFMRNLPAKVPADLHKLFPAASDAGTRCRGGRHGDSGLWVVLN